MLTNSGIKKWTAARAAAFYRGSALAVLVLLNFAVAATAQEYLTLPIDEKARGLRGNRSIVRLRVLPTTLPTKTNLTNILQIITFPQ